MVYRVINKEYFAIETCAHVFVLSHYLSSSYGQDKDETQKEKNVLIS